MCVTVIPASVHVSSSLRGKSAVDVFKAPRDSQLITHLAAAKVLRSYLILHVVCLIKLLCAAYSCYKEVWYFLNCVSVTQHVTLNLNPRVASNEAVIFQTAPSQQPPPEYTPISATAIRLTWGTPDYPNGVILAYNLYRDGSLLAALNSTGKFACFAIFWTSTLNSGQVIDNRCMGAKV